MGYIDVILAGLLVFPFVAALITFPYALFQYHKYGAVSKYRTLIIYSFVLYLLIAYFLVILPLPSRESTMGSQWREHLNLIPFNQVRVYWKDREVSLASIYAYLKSSSLWQFLFNILLTVPFGMYLRYYFKQSFGRTVAYSFLLSLFFELTQLSALYGIYPGPYRLADVGDLILNTLGGALGFQAAFVFMEILPDRDTIDARCRVSGQRVTGRRRLFAALFDYLCCSVLYQFARGGVLIFLPDARLGIFGDEGPVFWTFFCVLSLLQVLVTNGSTLGHAICRTTLVSKDGETAAKQRLVGRYLLLWLFTVLPQVFSAVITGTQLAERMSRLVILGIMALSMTYFLVYLVNQGFRRGEVLMPHDWMSKTMYRATEIPGSR